MSRLFRRRRRTEELACQELVELVTDYLEGALAPDLVEAFNDHITGCGNCSEYLRQMRRSVELARGLGEQAALLGPKWSETDPNPMLDELLTEFRARHPR